MVCVNWSIINFEISLDNKPINFVDLDEYYRERILKEIADGHMQGEVELHPTITLDRFIAHLEEEVANGSIYVWGAQGQGKDTISEAWIRKRETSSANAERAIKFWKKQVAAGYGDRLKAFDCSGLGMAFLQNEENIVQYDMSANGMLGKCERITKSQCRKGDWVFKCNNSGKATHIGYIVDNDLNVIEAKGRDDGVVKRPMNAENWNVYGRPCYFADEIQQDEYVSTVLPYRVRVTANILNIRKGHGINYDKNGSIRDKGIYTIVEESDGEGAIKWGKLKSGAGWIALDYTEKI